jgi:biotin carboxyl carrier protein
VRKVAVKAETPANVWQIRCAVGDRVTPGQELLVLESMKMEIPIEAPVGGVVREIRAEEGSAVKEGDVVAVIEAD